VIGHAGGRPSSPSVFFEVYALGQSIRRLLATAMADSPLTPEQYAIYSAIFEDEQITPTGMALRLGVPLTTVMDHVARLEEAGHARRTVDPRDRRATLVTLTANGLAAHRDANRYFERAYASCAKELAVDEATATRWLGVIRDAVDSALAASSVPAEQVGHDHGKGRVAVTVRGERKRQITGRGTNN
jgi:DNA-binding MarR family transcriptional regulator